MEEQKQEVKSDHSKVVATHYNNLEEKGLVERLKSRIFYMRNFNNFIKSMLINEYLQKIKDSNQFGTPLRVLDMCCGKGGDLLKWQKGRLENVPSNRFTNFIYFFIPGNITYLICTDIAEVSVDQCKTRYEKITSHDPPDRKSFKAEFFTCDSTRDRLRERFYDPAIELNLVSCQFAFHYCFETPRQAECMLKNASECLKPGGYFIGTIPDANEIMRRQKESGSEDGFGNDIYKIQFLSDPDDLPIFGAKYNFHLDGVVDCPEFLVYFPALVELAKKYSLKLVAKERFEDYYEQKVQSGKNLIEKMQALEPYGLFGNRNLSGTNEAEYSHAKEYLLRNHEDNNSRKRVGTLTKSEWEAITLYMVFAFQKVKGPVE
jgi:mRNA (guanine-N7-)-methyltransferase